MTIEQIDKIDVIGVNKKDGYVCLTISDHLEWDDKTNKLYTLQDKINSYLMFVESGQIYEEYPESINRKVVIELYSKYPPSEEGLKFINCIRPIIEEAGFSFNFKIAENE